MPAEELLCSLAGINPSKLTKNENLIIEAELFIRLIVKLLEYFQEKQKDYLRLRKIDREMEIDMFEGNFTRCIINDILSSEEYTLSGIACYTQIPEEIVYDLASGCNTNPSVNSFRKILELHRSVRGELYRGIIEKIILEYSANLY